MCCVYSQAGSCEYWIVLLDVIAGQAGVGREGDRTMSAKSNETKRRFYYQRSNFALIKYCMTPHVSTCWPLTDPALSYSSSSPNEYALSDNDSKRFLCKILPLSPPAAPSATWNGNKWSSDGCADHRYLLCAISSIAASRRACSVYDYVRIVSNATSVRQNGSAISANQTNVHCSQLPIPQSARPCPAKRQMGPHRVQPL